MVIDVLFVISVLSIVIMLYCLWLALSLKNQIPGGVVGKKWGQLTALVVIFAAGYLTTPFFGAIPENILRAIVALIFFFGAVYVLITVKLIFTIINELAD